MMNATHPDDERLAALAGHDPEADSDGELTTHVADCARCADLVAELGVLRASLAGLPDLAPSRPLRLLPPADDQPAAADRVGGWVRRFFAPLVTAGAALALVGVIGTTAPALNDMAASGESAEQPASELQRDMAGGADSGEEAPQNYSVGPEALSGDAGEEAVPDSSERLSLDPGDERDAGDGTTTLPAERSPWPMVLFSGVAVIVGALLLRWILVPRAG